MRIFAISDIHGDYEENLKSVSSISDMDYQDDALLVCGDLSHRLSLLCTILETLKNKFNRVFFVPGNHDVWLDQNDFEHSLTKFEQLLNRVRDYGIEIGPCRLGDVVLLPIFSWYDYSFAAPEDYHKAIWSDITRCKWPLDMDALTTHFLEINQTLPIAPEDTVITYSHFVSRLDILPQRLLDKFPYIIPFLGSHRIDTQIRKFQSQIHIFGHFHYNLKVEKDGILYINNALGYPAEGRRFDTLLYNIV